MADSDFTPEPRSAKGKYPHTRELTILETLINPTSNATPHIGVSYTPVQLEPCLLLKGKWLREADFTIGQKVTVTINPGEIRIVPTPPGGSSQ